MSEPTVNPTSDEAQASLAQADAMRRAGALAGYPPRWFGALTALTVAANVAGQAFDGVSLEWTAVPSVLALCVIGFTWRQGRVVSQWPSTLVGTVVFIVFLSLWLLPVIALLVTAVVLEENHERAWAPWAAALVTGAWTYAMFELGRLLRSRGGALRSMAMTSAYVAPPPRWMGAAFALALGGNVVLLALGLDGVLAASSVGVVFVEAGLTILLITLLGPRIVPSGVIWLGRLLGRGALPAVFQVGIFVFYAAGIGGEEWLQADWPAWAASAAVAAWTYAVYELARRGARLAAERGA